MGDAPRAVLACGCQGWDGDKSLQSPGPDSAGTWCWYAAIHTGMRVPYQDTDSCSGGRYHAVMQKHVPGCRYCTGRQVPYWDMGTGMKVPVLRCRSCKPNVSSGTGMQLLY